MGVLKTHHLVPTTTCSNVNWGLVNLITKECVPTEICHDLNARTTGQADYKAIVKYHFLKDPKADEKMLITFCTKKKSNCMGRAT